MNVKNKQPFLVGFLLCVFLVLTVGATYYKQITGPSSSTDNAILRWDGIRGERTQNSGITISDLGTIENGYDAVDAGFDLSAIFTTDASGITRSIPWDIGAYEYFESGGHSATANSATIGIIVFQ